MGNGNNASYLEEIKEKFIFLLAKADIAKTNQVLNKLPLTKENLKVFWDNSTTGQIWLSYANYPYTSAKWKKKYMANQKFLDENVKYEDFNWDAIFEEENPGVFIDDLFLHEWNWCGKFLEITSDGYLSISPFDERLLSASAYVYLEEDLENGLSMEDVEESVQCGKLTDKALEFYEY